MAEIYTVQTQRVIIELNSTSYQSSRSITHAIQTFIAQSSRSITHSVQTFIAQTKRRTSEPIQIIYQSVREVIWHYIHIAQSTRRINKIDTFISQTKRRIAWPISMIFQTRRFIVKFVSVTHLRKAVYNLREGVKYFIYKRSL